jgi:hypothetical protein
MTVQTLNNNVSYGEQRTKINANFADLDTRVDGAQTTADSKYAKPGTGIPKTDLATAVQTSLGKADTALQDATAFATVAQGEKADTAYQKPVTGIPETDIEVTESIDITANVTLTSVNKDTYNFKNWIFKGAYTVTINTGLNINALCTPPDTGVATIKAGSGVTLNKDTLDIEKTTTDCKVFSIFQMETDKYYVLGEEFNTTVNVVSDLTSTSDADALSASAGKNLNDRLVNVENLPVVQISSDVIITSANRNTYNNKAWEVTGTVLITLNENSSISAIVTTPDTGTVTIAFGTNVTGNGSNLSITRTKEETRVFSIIPIGPTEYEISTDTTPVIGEATSTVVGGIKLAGDLGGDAQNPTVNSIQGTPVSTVPPTTDQVFTFDSTGVARFKNAKVANATNAGVVDLTNRQVLGAGVKIFDVAVDVGHGSTAVAVGTRTSNLGIGAQCANGLQANSSNAIVLGRNSLSNPHSSFSSVIHTVSVGTSILPNGLTPTVATNTLDSNVFMGTAIFSNFTGNLTISRTTMLGAFSGSNATSSVADVISLGVGCVTGVNIPQRLINIGNYAGQNISAAGLTELVNIGHNAGSDVSGSYTVNVGSYAGKTAGSNCTNIGHAAGATALGNNQTHIGVSSGYSDNQSNTSGFGAYSLQFNVGVNATATGAYSARFNKSVNISAYGLNSCDENDGNNVTSVGASSCQFNKGLYTTSLGLNSGRYNRGDGNIYIGHTAGLSKGTLVSGTYLLTQTAAGVFSISPALDVSLVGKTILFEATVLTASPNNHSSFSVGTLSNFLVDNTTQVSTNVNKYIASQNTKSVTGIFYDQPIITNAIVIGRDSDADASYQIALGSPGATTIKYATATSPLYQDLAAIKTSVVGAVLYKTQPGSKDTITATTWGMPTTAPSIGQSLAAVNATTLTWVDAPFTPTAVAASRDLTAADNMRTLVLAAGVNINIPAGLTLNAVRIIPNGASIITSAAAITLNGSTSASITRNSSNNVLVDLQRISGNTYVLTGV